MLLFTSSVNIWYHQLCTGVIRDLTWIMYNKNPFTFLLSKKMLVIVKPSSLVGFFGFFFLKAFLLFITYEQPSRDMNFFFPPTKRASKSTTHQLLTMSAARHQKLLATKKSIEKEESVIFETYFLFMKSARYFSILINNKC